MSKADKSFLPNKDLKHAIDLFYQTFTTQENLPDKFPNCDIGELKTLDLLAPHTIGRSTRLDNCNAFGQQEM